MNKKDVMLSCGWDDCPESIRKKVEDILVFYRQSLGNNLTGFYLHGSLAVGCFNPLKSDIDFLVVVEHKLATQDKKTIIDYLLGIDNGSGSASHEMSIVTRDSLSNLVYPPPFELHYDSSWCDRFRKGTVDWEEQRYDPDLPMHFIIIRERGICLYGEPIKGVFPEIPREICIVSCANDISWINEQFDTLSPSYIVLNPCRALALLTEGIVLSKKEGGEWALSHLPLEFSGLINRALATYAGADVNTRLKTKSLREFYDYSRKEFARLSAKQIEKIH
jgi:predicted nucleotidyltransferase